jgi:hypothetical protein
MKPIFTNSIYAVFKSGSRYIVTLISNKNKVQYTGTKTFAIEWAIENGI